MNPNFHEINAASQMHEQDSVFTHHRRLIALRRLHPALIHGSYIDIDPTHEEVFAYTRTLGDTQLLVLINFSNQTTIYRPPNGIRVGETLLSNGPAANEPSGTTTLSLAGWQAIIYKVESFGYPTDKGTTRELVC